MAQLSVVADLSLDADGLAASVRGTGDEIVIETADPARLLGLLAAAALPAGVGTIDGPRAVGRLAEVLHGLGLHVVVRGPAGPVLALGAGPRSRLGRVVTGSPYASMGTWAAARPLVTAAAVRRGGRVLRSPAARAGSALLVLAAWVTLRRRRSTDS